MRTRGAKLAFQGRTEVSLVQPKSRASLRLKGRFRGMREAGVCQE